MAVTRGRIGTVEIDDGGGYVAIGRIVDADLAIESSEITVTSHDSADWEEFLQGRKSGTIEMTLRYDEADAGQQDAIDAAFAETVVTVRWRSRGATSGAQEYEASAFVRAFPIGSPNDEENKLGLTFRLTGAVTQATV